MLFFGDEQNVKCYEWYCLSSYQNNVTLGLCNMHTVFMSFLPRKWEFSIFTESYQTSFSMIERIDMISQEGSPILES